MTAHKCKNLSEWLSIGTHFHFARLADSVHLRGPSMLVAHPSPGPLTATYHGPPCAVAYGHCQPYLDVAPAHPTLWPLPTLHHGRCSPYTMAAAHPTPSPLPTYAIACSPYAVAAAIHHAQQGTTAPVTGSMPSVPPKSSYWFRTPPAPHLSPKNPFRPCPVFRLRTVTVKLSLP